MFMRYQPSFQHLQRVHRFLGRIAESGGRFLQIDKIVVESAPGVTVFFDVDIGVPPIGSYNYSGRRTGYAIGTPRVNTAPSGTMIERRITAKRART